MPLCARTSQHAFIAMRQTTPTAIDEKHRNMLMESIEASRAGNVLWRCDSGSRCICTQPAYNIHTFLQVEQPAEISAGQSVPARGHPVHPARACRPHPPSGQLPTKVLPGWLSAGELTPARDLPGILLGDFWHPPPFPFPCAGTYWVFYHNGIKSFPKLSVGRESCTLGA